MMKINVMQYLEAKPRLENSWRADMIRLLDALNDYLMVVKKNTKNHVIHTRISEIQHALEYLAQDFLNIERDNKKEMGLGYLNNWNEKYNVYKNAHIEKKELKPDSTHLGYQSLVKAYTLFKGLHKTTKMLLAEKKIRNFLLADWFALMVKYFKLIIDYEKL